MSQSHLDLNIVSKACVVLLLGTNSIFSIPVKRELTKTLKQQCVYKSLNSLCMLCCQIRSDKDKDAKVEYFLSGPGADKPPFNLFVVDHDTGFVRITDILDREKYPHFNVSLSLNKMQALYCTD